MIGLKRKPQPQSEPQDNCWRVRYTAFIEGAKPVSWDEKHAWKAHDTSRVAGALLLTRKTGQFGLVHEGTFYPPHRIREIKWETGRYTGTKLEVAA
jgi:hypothetical protein